MLDGIIKRPILKAKKIPGRDGRGFGSVRIVWENLAYHQQMVWSAAKTLSTKAS